ncbi:MAG: YicC family protein [Treponema sp.]|jgi:uncharacterized protein (TIGR00255 family)|nr:YicC family protein [Treponema sp.]
MKSMTGDGWAEELNEERAVSVEIKGYNNRFLDITVNLPSFLFSLESKIREYVAGKCRRGSIELSLRYREYGVFVSVAANREAARAYYDAACGIASYLGLPEKPSLADILDREGVLDVERNSSVDNAYDFFGPVLEKAFAAFEAERRREGAHTQKDICVHLAAMEKSLSVVESFSSLLNEKLKENIKSRFAELLGDAVDENRVLTETAALLVKYSISEEISRLNAHLKEFRSVLEQEEVSGKKLDFLCQEINREVNTIGSKAALLEVSREVVNMKDSLENIREQLRNVE